ncbi:MAG: hypothetical protein ABI923_05020, partial [bacterium]
FFSSFLFKLLFSGKNDRQIRPGALQHAPKGEGNFRPESVGRAGVMKGFPLGSRDVAEKPDCRGES